MKMPSHTLLDTLLAQTQRATQTARTFTLLDEAALNFRPAPQAWSILECLEHLNRYGDFYLVEIERCLLQAKQTPNPPPYQSGWMGNYFAHMMQVKEGKMTKMKTLPDKNPLHEVLSVTVLDKFLKQQESLVKLLHMAKEVDLNRNRTAISITRFITFRLGDTFRFFINHIERHVWQASQVAALLPARTNNQVSG